MSSRTRIYRIWDDEAYDTFKLITGSIMEFSQGSDNASSVDRGHAAEILWKARERDEEGDRLATITITDFDSMEPTEGLWHQDSLEGDEERGIFSEDGDLIADLYASSTQDCGSCPETYRANGARIVAAVNTYADAKKMIEALMALSGRPYRENPNQLLSAIDALLPGAQEILLRMAR